MKVPFLARVPLAGAVLIAVVIVLSSLAGCNTAPSDVQTQPAQVQPPTTVIGQTSTQQSDGTSVASKPSQIVHQANFGAWSYTAYKDGSGVPAYFGGIVINYGDVEAHVKFDTNSVAGVSSYIAASNQQLPQVAARGGLAEVWVSFRNFVPLDQFRAWSKKYDMTVAVSYMGLDGGPVAGQDFWQCPYSDDPSHTYVSSKPGLPKIYCPYRYLGNDPQGAASEKADPLPQSNLNNALKFFNDSNKTATTIKGVFFIRVWVDASQLPALAADPQVAVADVIPDVVRHDLAAAGVANADRIDVETNKLFFTMEGLGMLGNIDPKPTPAPPTPSLPTPAPTPGG